MPLRHGLLIIRIVLPLFCCYEMDSDYYSLDLDTLYVTTACFDQEL